MASGFLGGVWGVLVLTYKAVSGLRPVSLGPFIPSLLGYVCGAKKTPDNSETELRSSSCYGTKNSSGDSIWDWSSGSETRVLRVTAKGGILLCRHTLSQFLIHGMTLPLILFFDSLS